MAVTYHADRYLSPQSLFTTVTVLLGVYVVLAFASLGSSVLQLELLGRMSGGGPWTEEEAQQNDLREQVIAIIGVLQLLVTAIPFLKLLGRFNHNAWSFGAQGMKFTPGWTVGWFFVPVLNLFRPVQAVQEVSRISQPGSGDWTKRPTNSLVSLWWAAWIIANFLGQIAMRMARSETISGLQAATAFNILVEFVHIALAVVAWLMIRQITQWQEARHASGERYDGQQPACPACGEKVSLMLGNCQMCGADLTPTAASQDFN